MYTLRNTITIEAPIERIWEELALVDRLAAYDPGCQSSVALNALSSGLGARRRVDMKDGKNWFEEECTVFDEKKALKYDLTACSFPVNQLSHEYSFREVGPNQYEVTQLQMFEMKYGLIGKLLGLMIKSKWNGGIRGFLKGLKTISESEVGKVTHAHHMA